MVHTAPALAPRNTLAGDPHRPPIVAPATGALVYPPGRSRPGYPPADIPRYGQDRWQLAGLDHKQTALSKPVGWQAPENNRLEWQSSARAGRLRYPVHSDLPPTT